jgi:hypothetical protein
LSRGGGRAGRGCAAPATRPGESQSRQVHGEFVSECPGYCGAQDTFYVGTLKGVGRVYQQTFVDTYAKVGFAKLYDRKTPLTAADLLNDRVIPFYEEHDIPLQRVLTDRGTEYWGTHDRHEYELYLAVENIDHTRTKAKSPQTNGIIERFHKAMLDEFYRIALRKKLYATIDELQGDLDAWMREFNEVRPHPGKWCFGKTPMQTFLDALPLSRENCQMIARVDQPQANPSGDRRDDVGVGDIELGRLDLRLVGDDRRLVLGDQSPLVVDLLLGDRILLVEPTDHGFRGYFK